MTNVMEVRDLRPNPVLILSCASGISSSVDLGLSFDENDFRFFRDSSGRYDIAITSAVEAVDRRFARSGFGAALFSGNSLSSGKPLIIEPRSRNALFAPGNNFRDFTIEFWMYPLNLENGEQLLSWTATRPENGKSVFQRIMCVASRNRLKWSFLNFFTASDGVTHVNIEFSGDSPVVPKVWSHHLIRFDSATGLIEYLVNGKSETIAYMTSTGNESGEVYTPIAGTQGMFVMGERYTGMIDEFKIHSIFVDDNVVSCGDERILIQKYAMEGGRIETAPVDLGSDSSLILKIEAAGGRAGINRTKIINEFYNNGRFRFSDDSELNFFARACDNPWQLNQMEWTPFTPGVDIPRSIRGRYVQVAVDFYPSADGEASPYLDEVRIVYLPSYPPLPPRNVTAVAVDGAVALSWIQSPDAGTSGYLVYYSSVRGELYGQDAVMGSSPIDVGKRSNIVIDGLKNGTLYYFRIAAYDNTAGFYNIGEISREVTARPLAGLQ
jgi:hypothetical protein